jgi:hypothetical protein
MSKEHLSTYLNDHLAGAVMALEVIDQLATEAPDLKSILLETKSDIEADREQLISVDEKIGHRGESRAQGRCVVR